MTAATVASSKVPLPNLAYPIDDVRAWLDPLELEFWEALQCRDIQITLESRVVLQEDQALPAPRWKCSPEQQERLDTATTHILRRHQLHQTQAIETLMRRLVMARIALRQGLP